MEQFDRAVEQGRRQVMKRQISMLHELQGIGLNVFSHLSGATKLSADASIKMRPSVQQRAQSRINFQTLHHFRCYLNAEDRSALLAFLRSL